MKFDRIWLKKQKARINNNNVSQQTLIESYELGS